MNALVLHLCDCEHLTPQSFLWFIETMQIIEVRIVSRMQLDEYYVLSKKTPARCI